MDSISEETVSGERETPTGEIPNVPKWLDSFSEEEKNRPCFEDFVDVDMRQRPDGPEKRNWGAWLTLLTLLNKLCADVRQISLLTGKYKDDTEDFRRVQAEWWSRYSAILRTREYMCGAPWNCRRPLKGELMPERFYCGLLLSQEDADKYFTSPPNFNSAGYQRLVVKKPESAESYEKEMKEKESSGMMRQAEPEEEEDYLDSVKDIV